MAKGGVCGSSQDARSLKDMLGKTMSLIGTAIGDMESAAKEIKGGWNDDGVQEVDEILATIKRALDDAQEAAPKVQQSLEAYAEKLDQM